ncbi:8687_t:CDS:2 [Diversispora eburnea]|uniref:8687_t:CDS:1 n=1 Tax=Diversispora eburnea TaxID=1213867 RepID=A0A9N8YZI7_9GLOM|nr:8687_t:CDS:2 [Diversispora eburnea]
MMEPKYISFNNYFKYIDLLGTQKKLRRKDELIRPLTLICDNILNMDLYLDCHPNNELLKLKKLISVPKRQKETLKSLRLKSVNCYSFMRKSSRVGQNISLQELYINCCDGLHKSDWLTLASSFTHLNRFYFIYKDNRYSRNFITKILVKTNANLRNIDISLYPITPFDIFSTILNYCTKITELTLHNSSPAQVIAIFNNNFNELRRFSFDCVEISSDSLREFFKGWIRCCKGGGGNKKLRGLRILNKQIPLLELMGDYHFKVIEKYGIQLDYYFDLFPSLLINRIWCKAIISLLWELIIDQEYCPDHELRKKALCIRTYIYIIFSIEIIITQKRLENLLIIGGTYLDRDLLLRANISQKVH